MTEPTYDTLPPAVTRAPWAWRVGLASTACGVFILVAFMNEASFLQHNGQYWMAGSALLLISSVLCSYGVLTLILRRFSMAILLIAIFLAASLSVVAQSIEQENAVDYVVTLPLNHQGVDHDEVVRRFQNRISHQSLERFEHAVTATQSAWRRDYYGISGFDAVTDIQHVPKQQVIAITFTDFPPVEQSNSYIRQICHRYARLILEYEVKKLRLEMDPAVETLRGLTFDYANDDLDGEVYAVTHLIFNIGAPNGPTGTWFDSLAWLARHEEDPELKQFLLDTHRVLQDTRVP